MKVTKEGVYRDKNGKEVHVVDVGFPPKPYFRAYWMGGYYDVNDEDDGLPWEKWEMVEFVSDLPQNKH